jgi:hypothetical protein
MAVFCARWAAGRHVALIAGFGSDQRPIFYKHAIAPRDLCAVRQKEPQYEHST